MPLPKPRKGQTREKWLKSCMGNSTMVAEYPSQSQRYAVCNSQWDRRKKSIKHGVEVSEDEDIEEQTNNG